MLSVASGHDVDPPNRRTVTAASAQPGILKENKHADLHPAGPYDEPRLRRRRRDGRAARAQQVRMQRTGVTATTLELMNLRASIARKLGETDDRLFSVATWRDAPYVSDAERAALALTEAATRLSDCSDPVPDDVWEDAARHYDEQVLAGLVLSISLINVWNRLNVVTRRVAGQEW
jgi:alkylhydroperoxidase family enzyme